MRSSDNRRGEAFIEFQSDRTGRRDARFRERARNEAHPDQGQSLYTCGGRVLLISAVAAKPRNADREKIGDKVYLQPHAQVFALFDRPVTKRGTMKDGQYIPYNGVPSIYNFTGFLRERGFFWLASILFPANLASFISHLPPDEHFAMMRRFHQTMSVTLTLRDDPARSRIKIKDDRSHLDFSESRQDIENLRQCFLLAARGFLAVGARRVFLPMLRPPKIERESDLKQIEKMKFGYDDLLLYSDHTSGGNPYGKDAGRGVVDARGKLFGSENLYVADSSLFPTASGINPSWTIMALSHRVSSQLADSLG